MKVKLKYYDKDPVLIDCDNLEIMGDDEDRPLYEIEPDKYQPSGLHLRCSITAKAQGDIYDTTLMMTPLSTSHIVVSRYRYEPNG